jgi:hypothetical protein
VVHGLPAPLAKACFNRNRSGAEAVGPTGAGPVADDSNKKSEPTMSSIQRIGDSPRWSDIVIHNGVAQWVEVANDMSVDARSQIAQVLHKSI